MLHKHPTLLRINVNPTIVFSSFLLLDPRTVHSEMRRTTGGNKLLAWETARLIDKKLQV